MGSEDGRRPLDAEAVLAEAVKAFWVMVGVLAVIWIVQVVNWMDDYRLSVHYGIHSRDLADVTGIITAPFLHLSWGHIEGNSGPLFIFGFLAAFRGVKRFLSLTALIVVVSGAGAWLFSGQGTVTAGASGVVFGYFGYVIVRGFFDRHRLDIAVGLVMALCFAYQFTVLLPHRGISWQGHLFGFAAGIAGGWLLRDRRAGKVKGGETRPLPAPTGAAVQTSSAGTRADLLKQIDEMGL
ncbi:rhomboid family intramembrane serine protease [Actinomadura sp. DC4]|uniref:rhomboid family intramembrane serine protease n=1 Tax=Actinomadura sp. DC4 TaxID=3055069 RepID=UPI0025B24024|nr:rhomboid family intramembrane serine protease [Actinomadura sp. DC4]MDN3351004.1 rhomboid family intramembrane serine protease [Actinomadura sp. DC4]